jgi:hypothetical protein
MAMILAYERNDAILDMFLISSGLEAQTNVRIKSRTKVFRAKNICIRFYLLLMF